MLVLMVAGIPVGDSTNDGILPYLLVAEEIGVSSAIPSPRTATLHIVQGINSSTPWLSSRRSSWRARGFSPILLKLDVEADLAWDNLLKAGEPEIKTWAERKKYPTPSPIVNSFSLDLFKN